MALQSRHLLRLYEDGESEAATEIFDRYATRLMALAASRISKKLRRRIDAEDIVQSAYRSFFVHARDGEYQLHKSGDLWRLLARITLHKLYGQIDMQTARKRSIDREAKADRPIASLQAPEPTPVEAIAIAEQLQIALDRLSQEECRVLAGNWEGQSLVEISHNIGKSRRTARRLLANAKRKIEEQLLAEDEPSSLPQIDDFSERASLQYSDFVLEKLLGAGGMGKVFQAKEKRTGKLVAIKALHKSRQFDRRAVSQFVQEAQILTKLRHPHIVGMRGLGQFPGGGLFMVMEFVDGVDLRSRLHKGPLELSQTLTIAKQVAAAIQHAHEQGIVHCDLKPENVLLNAEGRAVITDFGFAFMVAGAASTQRVGGTAGFIAPEIMNRRSPPTPAADIFGMGMLTWTLLTDQPPHQFSLDAVEEPVRSIIARCVAAEPGKRFSQAGELLSALEKLERD